MVEIERLNKLRGYVKSCPLTWFNKRKGEKLTNKYMRDIKRLIRASGIPARITKRNSKHRRLILDGRTIAVFNEHADGSHDLHNIESILRKQKA